MIRKRFKNTKFIAISSGKGGVGKSNIAVNLSMSFARDGLRVCLFDADINLANINILLGLNPTYTLEHLYTENKNLNDIVFKGPGSIDVIAGASGISEFAQFNKGQQRTLIKALEALEKQYDYIIIDTAAGADDRVLGFLHAVPYVVLVITPEPTSLTDAFSLLKILKKQNYAHTIFVVINMVSGRKMTKLIFTRFNDAVSKYLHMNVRLAGYIVTDKNITQAVQAQQALLDFAPNCPATTCIESIASRLHKVFDKSSISDLLMSHFFKQLSDPLDDELPRVEEIMHQCLQLSDSEAASLWLKLNQHLELEPRRKLTPKAQKDHPITINEKSLNVDKKLDLNVGEMTNNFEIGLKQAIILAAQTAKIREN